jgi:hypothetical protein
MELDIYDCNVIMNNLKEEKLVENRHDHKVKEDIPSSFRNYVTLAPRDKYVIISNDGHKVMDEKTNIIYNLATLINNQNILDCFELKIENSIVYMCPKIDMIQKFITIGPIFNRISLIYNLRGLYVHSSLSLKGRFQYVPVFVSNLVNEDLNGSDTPLYQINTMDWLRYRKNNSKTYYMLPPEHMKIGNHIIDLKKCMFHSNEQKREIKICGGQVNDAIGLGFIPSLLAIIEEKPNLIVCPKKFIWMWVKFLTSKKYNYHLISKKGEHDILKYGDLMNVDFVIITIEYMLSYEYNDNIGTIDLMPFHDRRTILTYAKLEFSKFVNYNLIKSPIMSNMKWENLIVHIDDNKLDPQFFVYIQTIDSNYRWHVNNGEGNPIHTVNIICSGLYDVINFIDNHLVLYDEGFKPVEPAQNTFVWRNESENIIPCFDNVIASEHILTITKTEEIIWDIIGQFDPSIILQNVLDNSIMIDTFPAGLEIKDSEKKEFVRLVGGVINHKGMLRLSEIIEKKEENCSICYDSLKLPLAITSCDHIFCYKCLINAIKFNSVCPLCRHALTFENIKPVILFSENSKKYKLSELKFNQSDDVCIKFSLDEIANYLNPVIITTPPKRVFVLTNNIDHIDIAKILFRMTLKKIKTEFIYVLWDFEVEQQ